MAAALGTDLHLGLTTAQAVERLESYGPNVLEAAAKVPGWRKLLAQFADPLIYFCSAPPSSCPSSRGALRGPKACRSRRSWSP